MNKYLLPIAVGVLALFFTYNKGYDSGVSTITTQWNEERAITQKKVSELQAALVIKEHEYNLALQDNQITLERYQSEYAKAILSIHSYYADRLRDSTERYNNYRADAEGNANERRRLAEHTVELDKAITEGVRLVGELKETLELRESQLKVLYKQLQDEQKLRIK